MQFKCNCCGKVEDIDQWGAGDGASVSNSGDPPDRWRTIFTVIEEHDGKGGTSTSTGEVLHSCDDCNAYMTVEEHLEAEFEGRKLKMETPAAERAKPPAASPESQD